MKALVARHFAEVEAHEGPHTLPGIRFRPAGEALGVSSWGMNVLELDPHCSTYPEHDHARDGHEEVYVVLSGTVVVKVDGAEHVVSQGGMIGVPGALRRKLVTGGERAVVLALGGTPGERYSPSMGG